MVDVHDGSIVDRFGGVRIFQSGEGLLEVGVTEGGRGDGGDGDGDDDGGVMMSLRGVMMMVVVVFWHWCY